MPHYVWHLWVTFTLIAVAWLQPQRETLSLPLSVSLLTCLPPLWYQAQSRDSAFNLLKQELKKHVYKLNTRRVGGMNFQRHMNPPEHYYN